MYRIFYNIFILYGAICEVNEMEDVTALHRYEAAAIIINVAVDILVDNRLDICFFYSLSIVVALWFCEFDLIPTQTTYQYDFSAYGEGKLGCQIMESEIANSQ